jgi:hypothetical protein
MDNKETKKLKSTLNWLQGFMVLWAVFCYIYLALQEMKLMETYKNIDEIFSDAELFKKNTGYFLIKIFSSLEDIFLITFSILIFSFCSDKSKYSFSNLGDNSFWSFKYYYYILLLGIISLTLIKIHYNFYSYESKLNLIIQLVTFSILSIYVRNYKNKILSDLEDQS